MTVSATRTMPVPQGLVIAPQLPDLLLPVKVRRGIFGFLRNHPTVAVGGALLLLLVLIGVFAPYLGTVDPTALAPAKRTRAPSADFWFGTDVLGRDIYSRVLYGARVSLTVGLSVALFASLAGLAIGLVSGFVRSADGILMRFMDGLMSIPPAASATSSWPSPSPKSRAFHVSCAASCCRCASSPMWTLPLPPAREPR